MKSYTVYRIVNTVNGKYYIGVHKTDNPHDSYLGSGKAIRRAVEKYGPSNFYKEILHHDLSKKDAYALEKDTVGDLWKEDPDCYNNKPGGEGGWEHIDSSGSNNCMKRPEVVKKVVETRHARGNYHTPASEANVLKAIESNVGRVHTEESRLKKGASLKKFHKENPDAAKAMAAKRKGWKYVLITPDGEKLIIDKISEWCQNNQYPLSSITSKSSGGIIKRGKLKGWIVQQKYKD